MLGREITLAMDIIYLIPGQPKEYICTTEHVKWLKQAIQDSFGEVRKHLSESASKQKNYYDRRTQIRTFKPGDWVLRFYPPEMSKSKLNPQYIGPYLVLKQLGEVTYLIQRWPDSRLVAIHIDHLKPFEYDDPPHTRVTDTCNITGEDTHQETLMEKDEPQDEFVQNDVMELRPTNVRSSRSHILPSKFKIMLCNHISIAPVAGLWAGLVGK